MEKILVSACLLGENVRYDGENQLLNNKTLARWHKNGQLISLCPEVAGGLSIPRPPAEINQQSGLVITAFGEDVSRQFYQGAQITLNICKQQKIRFALLKESSPSCGSATIYDGNFSSEKMSGQGVTASLLMKNGIKVFSEKNIETLIAAIEVLD